MDESDDPEPKPDPEFMEQWPKQRKTVKSKASCGKTRRRYGRKNAKQRINGKRKINVLSTWIKL